MSQHDDHNHVISPAPIDDETPNQKSVLEELGIIVRPHATYEWNGYRYTNAADAIAGARRVAR